MPLRTARTEKLLLRVTRNARRALQAAADASHRSASQFVLESTLARADDARRFYLKFDFLPWPTRPMHLFVVFKNSHHPL